MGVSTVSSPSVVVMLAVRMSRSSPALTASIPAINGRPSVDGRLPVRPGSTMGCPSSVARTSSVSRPDATEVDPRLGQLVIGIGALAGDLVGPGHELRGPRGCERLLDGDEQHDPEHDEDGQRDAATPEREVEADAPKQPVLGGGEPPGPVRRAPRPGRRQASASRYPTPRTVSIWRPAAPSLSRR